MFDIYSYMQTHCVVCVQLEQRSKLKCKMQGMVSIIVNITPSNSVNTLSASPGEVIPSHAGIFQCLPGGIFFFNDAHLYMSFVTVHIFVLCSPFEVEVGGEAGVQKVRAWGPGLKTGMVGKSADFVVEAIGTDVGTLGEPRASDKRSEKRVWFPNVGILAQVSPLKARHRLKLNVTIKATAPAMCTTGPPSPATTLSTSFVTTRTSKTAPSSLTSFLQPMTLSQKR